MGATDIATIDDLLTNAAELRAGLNALRPGALDNLFFKPTPRAAGANRSVDIAGGRAVVGSPVVVLPTYLSPQYLIAEPGLQNSDTFEAGGIQAPHATFSRLDQIIARVYDNEGGQKKWRFEVLTGNAPTTNATLDNRHNAALLPAGVPCWRVCDIVVPTTGIITATEIRDRRTWAKGINWWARRTSGNFSPGTSQANIPGTSAVRLELPSGSDYLLRTNLTFRRTLGAGDIYLAAQVDGVSAVENYQSIVTGGNRYATLTMDAPAGAAAGSHLVNYQIWSDVADISVYSVATAPVVLGVTEIEANRSNG